MRKCALALLLFEPGSLAAATAIPLIDAHSHYEVAYASQLSCPDVLAAIDRAGVSRIVLTGQTNRATLECFRQAPQQVIPLYSVYESAEDKQRWMHRPEVIDRARAELQQSSYAGIGELHIFAPDVKSPVLRGLVELAAKHKLPLLLHADAIVVDEVFRINPRAQVLWAHMGTDPQVELLESRLLRHKEGLYLDTSVRDRWLLGNLVVNGPEPNRLSREWREFFIRHQDRVLVGIDTFSLNRWQRYTEVSDEIRRWLAQLPPDVAAKLAHINAERIFK